MRHQLIRLLAQPSYEGAYDIDQDPLWTHTAQALPIDVLAWYQCDHLGTPQELTDPNGQIVWSAQYKAWGEIKEQCSEWAQREGLTNPISDAGGLNLYAYAPNPTGWVDPLGLARCKCEVGVDTNRRLPEPIYKTTKDAKKVAESLGFKKS